MKSLAKIILASPLIMLVACSTQPKDGELNIKPAPIFTHPKWEVTQRAKSTSGERICTVSAGEIDITLHSYGDHVAEQVAQTREGDESSYYTISIGGHSYETKSDIFSADDSHAIIADFLTGDVAYTELSELGGPVYNKMRRYPNTISLKGFPEQYKVCQDYLAGKK